MMSGKTVHICDPGKTSSTQGFRDELARRVKAWFGLKVDHVDSDVGISSDTPLLLLCQNYSRIGTDIDTAASVLTGNSRANVAVIVIHTNEKHALPVTYPTENLYDEKYQEFGQLIDFAFTERDKIYDCKMNTDGDQKLKEFLRDKIKGRTEKGKQRPDSSSDINEAPKKKEKRKKAKKEKNETKEKKKKSSETQTSGCFARFCCCFGRTRTVVPSS